jgi:hypothetical protein
LPLCGAAPAFLCLAKEKQAKERRILGGLPQAVRKKPFQTKNMPKNVCVLVNISLLKQSVAAPLFIINSPDLLTRPSPFTS